METINHNVEYEAPLCDVVLIDARVSIMELSIGGGEDTGDEEIP